MIRIVDGPIPTIDDIEELPAGEIGELIVSGPQVTRCYVTRVEANRTAKIADDPSFSRDTRTGVTNEKQTIWHRMGDAGYFDAEGRFWFCGRVAHRVLSAGGALYPVCCEAIFNQHPDIFRSALVGVAPAGNQRPVIVLEPKPGNFPEPRPQERLCWTRSAGSGKPVRLPSR